VLARPSLVSGEVCLVSADDATVKMAYKAQILRAVA